MRHANRYRFSRSSPRERRERRLQAGRLLKSADFAQGVGAAISAGDPGASDNLTLVRMKIPLVRSIRFIAVTLTLVPALLTPVCFAQSPPFGIWTPNVMQRIRDRSTLNPAVVARAGYFEVSFDSETGEANWADSESPYALHTGDTIRIHGYLATPLLGGPYPAIVIGHGHGGHGSAELAIAVAALGYVALSIDGPMSGRSSGGPQDTPQAWISVEPSANYSYLYHYAYAGMRALTLLESLSRLPFNPFRIDRNKFGVLGASMGGQFTYYINGIDSRVKGAVAIAVAGDWHKIAFYPGSWLYHGLYYYTRDGLASGVDALNTISDACTDWTLHDFLDHFDPIHYAPRQHAPLLTIIGTHDQYFTLPAINTTFDQVESAGTNGRFIRRILLSPNGKHGVINQNDFIGSILSVLSTAKNWFKYCFDDGPTPPQTPTVKLAVIGDRLSFEVNVGAGSSPIARVRLYAASEVNTLPSQPNDFGDITLSPIDNNTFAGSIPIGALPPSGPPVTPDNVLYFAQVQDSAGYTISSKMYYKSGQLDFCGDFLPVIEHFPGDNFPVQAPPAVNCACPQ